MSARPPLYGDDARIPEAGTVRYFFARQPRHLIALAYLLLIAWTFAVPAMGDGVWLGVTDTGWFLLAVGLPVVHQVLVWLVFRGQLGWSVLSRLFGRADLFVWGLLFMPLLIARPIAVIALALSDRGSMALPPAVRLVAGALLLIPSLYTLWSVARYFGIARALGGDHFRLRYREMPFVRRGAFRWSPNAMYACVFLLLWAAAFILGSRAALSAALFQHAYIWVHYHCTEEPDLRLMYGG